MAKKKKDIREYYCGYCGYDFEQEIKDFFVKDGCHNNGSNQVKCPRCNNFLKNDEGKRRHI